MSALLYRMAAGIPGDVNRAQHHIIEPANMTPSGTTGHPTSYGVPVVVDATTQNIRVINNSDTSALVYGFLVRPYPSVSSQDGVGTSTPPLTGPCDVLRRGYMSVTLISGTAKKAGQVYIWGAVATGTHVQGGVEATDPTSNGFALTGCQFVGPADANGITEIAFRVS